MKVVAVHSRGIMGCCIKNKWKYGKQMFYGIYYYQLVTYAMFIK